MPPRTQQPTPIRITIAELPPGEGRKLPHNGYLPEEIAAAQQKGYIPVDVRWEAGQHRVDLVGQGLLIGSVILNPNQMSAYEAEVKLYKETRPIERAPAALTESIIDRLATDFLPGKLAAKLQNAPRTQEHAPPDPVKRLTQPKGEVELAIASEIQKLMEKA